MYEHLSLLSAAAEVVTAVVREWAALVLVGRPDCTTYNLGQLLGLPLLVRKKLTWLTKLGLAKKMKLVHIG